MRNGLIKYASNYINVGNKSTIDLELEVIEKTLQ